MNDPVLSGLVRVGIVTDRDPGRKAVRVVYPDCDLSSGWLSCLQTGSGATAAETDGHTHTITLGAFVPAINARVAVLYLPVEDGDGFVLGVLP